VYSAILRRVYTVSPQLCASKYCGAPQRADWALLAQEGADDEDDAAQARARGCGGSSTGGIWMGGEYIARVQRYHLALLASVPSYRVCIAGRDQGQRGREGRAPTRHDSLPSRTADSCCGRGHAPMLTDFDACHPKTFRNIGHLPHCAPH
jgi:hypothetical protein